MASGGNKSYERMKQNISAQMRNSAGGGAKVAEIMKEAKTVTEVTEAINEVELTYLSVDDFYAAPIAWNFYPPYTQTEKEEMVESIKASGVIDPIILWQINRNEVKEFYQGDEWVKDPYGYQFAGDEYMILSGHNRADAAILAYKTTGDKKYLRVPARIIFKDGKDDTWQHAKDIILDTNYHQRKKPEQVIHEEIIRKCKQYEVSGYNKRKTVELVSNDLDIAKSTIYIRLRLDQAIPEIKELFYAGEIKNKVCYKLSDLRQDVQHYLYDHYRKELSDKNISKVLAKINYDTPIEKLDLIMSEINVERKYKSITVQIPADKEDDFKKLVKKWLTENDVSPKIQ